MELSSSVNTTMPLYVKGTAYSLEPVFHVRWACITLPALLTLLSSIFVCATICASYRTGTPILGSGLRALVLCQIDEGIRERLDDADNDNLVEKTSKNMKMGMKRDGHIEGWRMTKTQ